MYFFNMRVMKVTQTVYYKPYVIYNLKELLCFSIYYYTTHLHFCQVLFGNLLKFFLRSNTKCGIKPPIGKPEDEISMEWKSKIATHQKMGIYSL